MKTKRYLFSLTACVSVLFLAFIFDFDYIQLLTHTVNSQRDGDLLISQEASLHDLYYPVTASGKLPIPAYLELLYLEGIAFASANGTDTMAANWDSRIMSDVNPDVMEAKLIIFAEGYRKDVNGTSATITKEPGGNAEATSKSSVPGVRDSSQVSAQNIASETSNDNTGSADHSVNLKNDDKTEAEDREDTNGKVGNADDTANEAAQEAPVSEVIEEEEAKSVSLYSDIGISIAKSYVNIRKAPSTDSEVLGKLYRNSACRILSSKDGWYYVESGSVTGYVSSEFIKTGIPDEELIRTYGTLKACVTVDGLNVREKPITKSKRKTVIYLNEVYPVISVENGWVKLEIEDDDVIGFVVEEYVEIIVQFPKAVSREEELELLRLKEEQRIKEETAIKYRDEVDYTREELKLLACLVHAEAGNQSYEGKLAVANIVLNRVRSSKYPDSIKDVIYQAGQFSVASSGSLAKQLANYSNYKSKSQLLSIKAAKAALEGANNIGKRLYFHAYKTAVKKGYDDKPNSVKLEDQLFW